MSHNPERQEKICLNCGSELHGRFCHNCAQENVEPKETFWHLVTHFVYDVTHFDGKFFSTVKYLLTKPGFLSSEYIKGKRMSYLNPIKMYVFTSAFFFIFFFSAVVPKESLHIKSSKTNVTSAEAKKDISEAKERLEKSLAEKRMPPVMAVEMRRQLQSLEEDSLRLLSDTTHLSDLSIYKRINFYTELDDENYVSASQYDSVQNKLPANKRDGWLKKQYYRKKLTVIEKYKGDNRAILSALFDKFFHSFPQVLFISLPLFALLLKLFYIRRKQFYYVDHVIYSVHLYCAMFVMIFLLIIFSKLDNLRYFGWVSVFSISILFYIFWYIYKSIRNFYKQSRGKTLLKFFILMFTSIFVMTMLFTAFFIFSAFTI